MMRYLLLFFLLVPFLTSAEQQKQTTIILVRHAEKQLNAGDNPQLSTAGESRSRELARILGSSGITAIYSCPEHVRTWKTAEPLAQNLKLQRNSIDADQTDAVLKDIFAHHNGEVVLIVGHSDTVPEIIQALGAKVPPIGDNEYDNLYVVTASAPGTASVVRLKYGAGS
jgi:2,3-bisphosphoglycerate-dependent phosphoglycerate mutase